MSVWHLNARTSMTHKTQRRGIWVAFLVGVCCLPLSHSHEWGRVGSGYPLGSKDSLAEAPNYDFEYIVRNDPDGQLYGASENRDGDNTRGFYFVDLPDGRRQKVTYYVTPESGYVAEISYEQIYDASEEDSSDGRAFYDPALDHDGLGSVARTAVGVANSGGAGASTSRGLFRENGIQVQPFPIENLRTGDASKNDFSLESESKSTSFHDVAHHRQTTRPGALRAEGDFNEQRTKTGSGISATGVALPILTTNARKSRNFFWKSNRKLTDSSIQTSSSLSPSRSTGVAKSGEAVKLGEGRYPQRHSTGRNNHANIQGAQSQSFHPINTNRQKGTRIRNKSIQEENPWIPKTSPSGSGYVFSKALKTQNINARIKEVLNSPAKKAFSSVKTIVRPLGRDPSTATGSSGVDFQSAERFNANGVSNLQASNFQPSLGYYAGKLHHSSVPNASGSSLKPTSSRRLQSTLPSIRRSDDVNTLIAPSQETQNIFDYDSFIKSLKPEDFSRKVSRKIPHNRKKPNNFEHDQFLSVSRLREISAISLPEKPRRFDDSSFSKQHESQSGFGPPRLKSLHPQPPTHGGFKPSFVRAQPQHSRATNVQLQPPPPEAKLTPKPGFKPSPRVGVPLPVINIPSSERTTFSSNNVGVPLPSQTLRAKNKQFPSFSTAKNGNSGFRPSVNRLSFNGNFGSRIIPGKLVHRKKIPHTDNELRISLPATETISDRKSSSDNRGFGVPLPAATTASERRRAPLAQQGTARPSLALRPARRLLDFDNIGVQLPSFNALPDVRRQESSTKFRIRPPSTKMLPPDEVNSSSEVGIPLPVFQSRLPGTLKGTRASAANLAAPSGAPSFVIKSENGKTLPGRPLPSDTSVRGHSSKSTSELFHFDKRNLFVQQLEPVSKIQLNDEDSVAEVGNVPENFQRRNLNVANKATQHESNSVHVGVSLPDVLMPPPSFKTKDQPADSSDTGVRFTPALTQLRPRSSSSSAIQDRRLDDSVFLEDDDVGPTRFGFNIQAGVGPRLAASRRPNDPRFSSPTPLDFPVFPPLL